MLVSEKTVNLADLGYHLPQYRSRRLLEVLSLDFQDYFWAYQSIPYHVQAAQAFVDYYPGVLRVPTAVPGFDSDFS